MYAIFKSGDKQFKAEKGVEIKIPYLAKNVKGDKIVFNDVLLAHDGNTVKIGNPVIANASVTGELVCHEKDKKVVIQKFKRRKRYNIRTGHRQNYSKVLITGISVK